MEIKDKDIYEFYENIDEDMRLKRTKVNRIEFLTTVRYLDKTIKTNSKILDPCAGGGIYAFYLAEKGHRVTAGDLIQKNVNQMKNIQEDNKLLEEIYQGSILDLSQFEDNSFDVVLNLGSFYHLTDPLERKESIIESLRVLKPNGLYMMSYINRYANIIKYRDMIVEDFSLIEDYLEKGFHYKNHIFYASYPGEVEEVMKEQGIEMLHNIATDGMKFIIRDTVNKLNDTDFEKWMDMHYKTCEDRSIIGTSEHGLFIGRKQLPNMEYTVIESYKTNYPNPITIKKDMKVTIGDLYIGEENWENWRYCYTLDNENQGWVPEQLLGIENNHGIVLDDYTAKELNVEKDEIVKGVKELNGWLWCIRLLDNDEGWLPKEILK